MVAVEISTSELRRIEQRSPGALQLIHQSIDYHHIAGTSVEDCLSRLNNKELEEQAFEIAKKKGANVVYFERDLTTYFRYDPDDKRRLVGIDYPFGYSLYRM